MFMPASTILFAILLENMLHDIRKQVCTYFFSSPRFHRSYTYSIDILELFYCPFTVPILRFVYTTYAAKYPEKAANPGNVRSWGKYFSIHDSLPTEIHNESQCFHSVRHIPGKSQNPVAQLNPSYGKPPRGFVWRRVNDSYYCRSLFALSITRQRGEVLQPRVCSVVAGRRSLLLPRHRSNGKSTKLLRRVSSSPIREFPLSTARPCALLLLFYYLSSHVMLSWFISPVSPTEITFFNMG